MKKILLVGFGRVGKMYYENLKRFPDVKTKYILDDYVSCKNFPNVKRTCELKDILRDQDIDACVITESASMHFKLIKIILEFKKHIFCENPIWLQED